MVLQRLINDNFFEQFQFAQVDEEYIKDIEGGNKDYVFCLSTLQKPNDLPDNIFGFLKDLVVYHAEETLVKSFRSMYERGRRFVDGMPTSYAEYVKYTEFVCGFQICHRFWKRRLARKRSQETVRSDIYSGAPCLFNNWEYPIHTYDGINHKNGVMFSVVGFLSYVFSNPLVLQHFSPTFVDT